MNNKGQSLVLFVLLVPLVLLVLLMVYEVGRMTLLRHTLDSINMIAMDYGVSKLDDDSVIDKVHELILKNKSDIDQVIVDVNDGKLYITLATKLNGDKSLFKDIFNVTSSYVGYMENDKKIIERNK